MKGNNVIKNNYKSKNNKRLLFFLDLRAKIRATATAYAWNTKKAEEKALLTARNLIYYLIEKKITEQEYNELIDDYQRISCIDEEIFDKLILSSKKIPKAPKYKQHNNPINYKKKYNFLNLIDAEKELKIIINKIMTECSGDFNVLTGTPGVGKTLAVATVLQNWEKNGWPKIKKENSYIDLRVLYLTDTRAQAEEFYKALAAGRKDNGAPLFAGIKVNSPRDADNCWEFEKVNPYVTDMPGGYCYYRCPRRDACRETPGRYVYEQEQFKSQRLQIATKDAILHGQFDEIEIRKPNIVIIDGSLLPTLIKNKDFDFDALTSTQEAVKLALKAEEKYPNTCENILTDFKAKECIKYINHIIKKLINKDTRISKKIKKNFPILSESELKVIERWRFKGPIPRRFFSLLQNVNYNYDLEFLKINGKYKLRISYIKNNIFNYFDDITIINIDSNPVNSILNRFKRVIINDIKVKQNSVYYQMCDLKLHNHIQNVPEKKYPFSLSNFQSLEIIKAGGYFKVGVITYKNDINNVNMFFSKYLPEIELVLGHWGNDHKATNDFEHCDILILKGGYWQNEQTTRQRARLLGVDARDLAKDLFEADLIQAIGRARAVRRLKPIPILIFDSGASPGWVSSSRRALPLDGDPLYFFDSIKTEKIFEIEKKLNLHCDYSKNIINNIENQSEPELQTIFNTKLTPATICSDFVSGRLADLGFYCHSLAGFTLPPEQVTEDMPAGSMSQATYNRYIKPILDTHPRHILITESGGPLRVWGSLDAARAYLAVRYKFKNNVPIDPNLSHNSMKAVQIVSI